MIDYKEEVKKLITEMYAPADTLNKEFELTTAKLVKQLRAILPINAIDDHLVYEALIELDFKPEEKKPLKYLWYFKRK